MSHRWGRLWFGWWVCICLGLLAWNTHGQLATQHRILAHSQELERIVTEAAKVSTETNEQLAKVKQLDTATTRLDQRLQQVGEVNAAIKTELLALESTVRSTGATVATMDRQAAESRLLLDEIARQSADLHGTLVGSSTVASDVSKHLASMVRIQEALNTDLADMNDKTQFLDRFIKGE